MKLEGHEKKREGKWELTTDILQSTGVRPEPSEQKAKPPEAGIMETVYKVLTHVGGGK